MTKIGGPILVLVVLQLFCTSAFSAGDDEARLLRIGYVEILDDHRYDEKRAYARIRVKPHHRPVSGAELAIRDSRVLARALGTRFELTRVEAQTVQDAVREIRRLQEDEGVNFYLADADADALIGIAASTTGSGILLFNITEHADRLRGADCRAHLFHVIPSYAMLSDALAQYLAFKNWRRVMVLKGPLAEDREFAAAFERSANRFGISIDRIREILPGNDPRAREQTNMALITSGSRADLVFVSDIEGEIGRGLPYRTQAPLIVVGSEGLQASSWHWAWERHGAPQLNQRFEAYAGRRMQGGDWAAWTAVKSIIESVSRNRPDAFEAIEAYLRGKRLNLDAYKGTPVSYRDWDNQLRQPVLLHTYNAIVDRAPIDGFLHPVENMDTLGYDRAENRCRFEQPG